MCVCVCVCVCVCEGGLHSQRGEESVCVRRRRLLSTTSTFPLPTHLLHKRCVRRESSEKKKKRACGEENDAASSSHLPHHPHTCCISGVSEEAYPRQSGEEEELTRVCHYGYDALESRRHRSQSRGEWHISFSLCCSAAIPRCVCVCVGERQRTCAAIAKNPRKLFFSRVSAGEGDDGRRREVEPFPASSLSHKERWVENSSTMIEKKMKLRKRSIYFQDSSYSILAHTHNSLKMKIDAASSRHRFVLDSSNLHQSPKLKPQFVVESIVELIYVLCWRRIGFFECMQEEGTHTHTKRKKTSRNLRKWIWLCRAWRVEHGYGFNCEKEPWGRELECV